MSNIRDEIRRRALEAAANAADEARRRAEAAAADAAARRNIERARNAIMALESANNRMRQLSRDSGANFVGRAGDEFRAALERAINRNRDEADRIHNTLRQIEAMRTQP